MGGDTSPKFLWLFFASPHLWSELKVRQNEIFRAKFRIILPFSLSVSWWIFLAKVFNSSFSGYTLEVLPNTA